MKLTVNHDGVWLDENEIKNCTQIDIKNITPIDKIQVVLHLAVDEVDVQYHSEEIRFH